MTSAPSIGWLELFDDPVEPALVLFGVIVLAHTYVASMLGQRTEVRPGAAQAEGVHAERCTVDAGIQAGRAARRKAIPAARRRARRPMA